MATNKSNTLANNSSINQSNPFFVNTSTGESALLIDPEGNVIV